MVERTERTWISGLACVGVALLAVAISRLPFPPFTVGESGEHPLDPLFLAILAGFAWRNLLPANPSRTRTVVRLSKVLLPVAIALMGARLDVRELLAVSGVSLVLSIVCVALGFGLTLWIGRRAGLSTRFAALLGIGTGICGGTAIAVLAPVVRAESEETALSMATVTVLGTLAILVLPPVGLVFAMSQGDFGLWTGLAVHATPQVIATGFAYGPDAGETALIVKLIRVLLLIPFLILAQLWLGRSASSGRPKASKLFPPFILGFLALVALNSLGWLALPLGGGVELGSAAVRASSLLFAVAMVGVGYEVDLRRSLAIGPRPFAVGTAAFLVMAALSWVAVSLWAG